MYMRRVVVFGLLGPTLGFLMGLITASALGIPPFDGGVLLIVFAYAYAAGVIPAVLAGLLDGYLSPRVRRWRRVLLTAGGGYFLSALVGLTLLNRRISIEASLVFALYGMIAAAICSALAGPGVLIKGASAESQE
jgi:hypothetical protein